MAPFFEVFDENFKNFGSPFFVSFLKFLFSYNQQQALDTSEGCFACDGKTKFVCMTFFIGYYSFVVVYT
jgi:hypothetical protein